MSVEGEGENFSGGEAVPVTGLETHPPRSAGGGIFPGKEVKLGRGVAAGVSAAGAADPLLAGREPWSHGTDRTIRYSLPCQAYAFPVDIKKGGCEGNFPFGGRAHWHRTELLGWVPER